MNFQLIESTSSIGQHVIPDWDTPTRDHLLIIECLLSLSLVIRCEVFAPMVTSACSPRWVCGGVVAGLNGSFVLELVVVVWN